MSQATAAPTPSLRWPVRLICTESAGIERRQEPVTAGVPLPPGLLHDPEHVTLTDERDAPIALQSETLSRWPDGSVRWLLLDFAADVAANGRATYLLTEEPASSSDHRDGQSAPASSFFGMDLTVALRDAERRHHFGSLDPRSLRLEALGRQRTSALSSFALSPDLPGVRVTVRAHTYSAQPEVRLDLTVTNHRDKAVSLELLQLTATVPGAQQLLSCAGLEGAVEALPNREGARVEAIQTGPTAWQAAQPFRVNGRDGRLNAAWCAALTDRVRATLVVRRFAAMHPKGVWSMVAGGAARLGAQLVPPGCGGLTLLPGMAATMECLLRVEPAGALQGDPDQVARRFDAPLHAFADPAWVCATGVMGDLVPADDARFPRYEWLARGGLDALAAVRERRHEYGQLDYGDWAYDRYPRGWGNVEYDLPHALFLLYARSGERRFFDWAVDAARHYRDVDVNHGGYPDLPAGAPHAHHTDHAARGNDLGHTWLEGLLDSYLFTGDRRAFEAARGIAEFCVQAAVQTDFRRRSERGMGWLLICLTAMHRATLEARYLDGCAPIVEQALAWQAPEGNWPNPIGECDRTPKCLGGKPFMVGIVLEGLRRYHELTRDVRAGEAIVRAARWLVTDGVWVARDRGWVYATCHKFLGRGRTGEVRELDGLLYAYRLAGEPRFLEVALDAWDACLQPVGHPYGFAGAALDGKGYATLTRSTPHVLARLAALVPDRRW